MDALLRRRQSRHFSRGAQRVPSGKIYFYILKKKRILTSGPYGAIAIRTVLVVICIPIALETRRGVLVWGRHASPLDVEKGVSSICGGIFFIRERY